MWKIFSEWTNKRSVSGILTPSSNSIVRCCSLSQTSHEAVNLRLSNKRLTFSLLKNELHILNRTSVQFSSVTQSCPTVCNPMDCSTPGLPIHHQLPEFTQTQVHWVSDAIQPSHPLSPRLLTPSIFPSIRIFSNKSVLCIRWPEYHQISFRMDWLEILAVQGTLKSLLQHHSSKASISSALSFLYSATLTSIHDYWKNHSFD